MTDLISTRLADSISEQIGQERYNASLYLAIAGFMRSKGLGNVAKHFTGQHDEEMSHSMMFFDLLTDLNVVPYIPKIEGVTANFSSPLDIARVYLEVEILTTNSIHSILRLALSEGNAVVEEKMRHMISLQQAEYAEATDFFDKAENMNEWWQWTLYDASLG